MPLGRMLRAPRSWLRAAGFDVIRHRAPHQPNTRRLRALRDHHVDVAFDVGAADGGFGDSDGQIAINVSARDTSSSILPMLPTHIGAAPDSAYLAKETVPITTLDSIVNGLVRERNRLYLKIDVQGYERNVLLGAAETLKRVDVVEVEVSTIALYDGSILYAELISWLDRFGFHLISWEDVLVDPKNGFVLQADCIFSRPV